MTAHGARNESGNRWCDACAHEHGPLYPCESYPTDVLAEIDAESAAFRANLRDPKWCQEQLDSGLPPEGLVIFRAFAGVDEPSPPSSPR